MMRRYIGRAHGTRRKPKQRPKLLLWQRNKEPFLWALAISAALLGLVLIAVLIFNPGDNSSDGEKGSRPSSGVTPTTETSPPAL